MKTNRGNQANSIDSGIGASASFAKAEDGISCREFLDKSFKAGISVTALATFLSSCGITGGRQGGGGQGGGSNPPINIAINESPWLPSFEEIVRIYQEETGSTVNLRVFTFEGLLSKTLNAARSNSKEFDISTSNAQTITVGIATFIQQYQVRYGDMSAAAAIATIPIIVVAAIAHRYIVTGLTGGAVKG